jgi:hypothetical protein
MKLDWAQVGTALGTIAGGVAAIYGALKGYTDGRTAISDWLASRPKDASGFAVNATVSKVLIWPDRTEFIKLRTVRAHRRVASLRIDPVPTTDPQNRKATVSNLYSVPGRASVSPDEMLQIDLLPDEELTAHKDHSVVLGYTMEETRDVLFTPPGVSLVPPVGSDYAVIEAHFEGRRLSTNGIRFYSRHIETKAEANIEWPSEKANVTFPAHDPDWIRARINKPPQDSEIHLDWQWI